MPGSKPLEFRRRYSDPMVLYTNNGYVIDNIQEQYTYIMMILNISIKPSLDELPKFLSVNCKQVASLLMTIIFNKSPKE